MIVDSFNRTFHRVVEGDYERVDFVRGSNVRLWKNDLTRTYETHWHSAVEIISPITNIYTVNIHDKKYIINPGEIIVIPAGELHEVSAPESGERYAGAISKAVLQPVAPSAFRRAIALA